MRNPDGKPDAKIPERSNQMGYTHISKVCKTFIRRFDPDPRLQYHPSLNPYKSTAIPATLSVFPPDLRGVFPGQKRRGLAKRWRSASKSLTRGLTRFPQKPDVARPIEARP